MDAQARYMYQRNPNEQGPGGPQRGDLVRGRPAEDRAGCRRRSRKRCSFTHEPPIIILLALLGRAGAKNLSELPIADRHQGRSENRHHAHVFGLGAQGGRPGEEIIAMYWRLPSPVGPISTSFIRDDSAASFFQWASNWV